MLADRIILICTVLVAVIYLWATTLSYQAFRGTTFVLLVLFMFRFLPVMVGVKLLATGLNRGVRLARPAWVSGPA